MDKNVKAIIATPQNGERNMELTWVTEHSKKSVTEHLGEAELPRTSLQALQETYTKMGKKMGRTVSKDWLAILGHNTLKFARLLFAVFSPFQLCHDQPEPACNASHEAASWGPIRLIQQQSIRKTQPIPELIPFNQSELMCFSCFYPYIIYTFNALPSLGSAPSSCVRAEPSPEQKSQQGSKILFTYSIIHSMLTSELKPNLPTTTLNCYCL